MIATEGLSVQPAMAGGVVRSGRFWVNAVQPLVSTRQVPGARWYTVVIRGGSVCAEEAGAGFCQDALRAAAELVREVSAIALAHENDPSNIPNAILEAQLRAITPVLQNWQAMIRTANT